MKVISKIRYNKTSYKFSDYPNRLRYPHWIDPPRGWWYDWDAKRFINREEMLVTKNRFSGDGPPVKSIRAALRRIRKANFPKGSEVRIVSLLVGFEVKVIV